MRCINRRSYNFTQGSDDYRSSTFNFLKQICAEYFLAESCLERIYQLGGILPNDATEFIKISGCEFLQLPTNPTDHKAILEKCLKAEQGAIVNWNKICQMTFGKDPVTYDIAKDILAEEIEHESWFLELIYGRPSGHMRRKYSGERPHTGKHSRALDMA